MDSSQSFFQRALSAPVRSTEDSMRSRNEIPAWDHSVTNTESSQANNGSQLRSMKQRLDFAHRQTQEAQNACDHWRDQCSDITQENQYLLQENQHLRLKQRQGDNEIRRLNEKNSHLERAVVKAQKASLTSIAQSISADLPDNRIRQRFDTIFDSITDWVKENAATGLGRLGSEDRVKAWHEKGFVKIFVLNPMCPDYNIDIESDTLVDTLLNAALTHAMSDQFLMNPFFFLESTHPMLVPNYPTHQLASGTYFQEMYTTWLRKGGDHQAEAHAWRANTIKSLANAKGSRDHLEKFYSSLTEAWLKEYQTWLQKDMEQSEQRQLFEVVRSFGNLALDLWSQKPYIKCFFPRVFAKFSSEAESRTMEAAQAMKLEEGDDSLYGRPIPVVVQPLIRAYGSPDGKDYSQSRVLSKAVVWVSDKKEPSDGACVEGGR